MGYLGSNVVLIQPGNHICRFGYFQMQSNVANKCSNSQLKRTTCQVNCANFHLSSLWLSWIELRSLTLAIGQPHFLPTYSTVVLPLPLPADLDKGGNLCCSIAPVAESSSFGPTFQQYPQWPVTSKQSKNQSQPHNRPCHCHRPKSSSSRGAFKTNDMVQAESFKGRYKDSRTDDQWTGNAALLH